MSEEPNPIQPPELPKHKSSMLAVCLALVPSILLLTLFTFFGRSNPPAILFIVFCGISIVCCFGASILLFRRKTALAILFGILFLLLNGALSFLFGCGAILTQMKF